MIDLATATAEELLALAESNLATGFEPQATTVVPQPQPQADHRPQPQPQASATTGKRGRPRFDDPTDPAQIWAICNRKGTVTFLRADTLGGAWVEQAKSKLKNILQNLGQGPIKAEFVENPDGWPEGTNLLLIG